MADIAVAVAAVVVIHHATTIFSVELHTHTFGDISKSTYCMAVFFSSSAVRTGQVDRNFYFD